MLQRILVRGSLFFLCVCVCFSSSFADDQGKPEENKLDTPGIFGALKAGGLPDRIEETEEFLRSMGLVKKKGKDVWSAMDSRGETRVLLFPETRSYVLLFFPANRGVFPGPALAALISKSDSVYLGGGDEIEVMISKRTTSRGTAREWLHFSLADGSWTKSTVYFEPN